MESKTLWCLFLAPTGPAGGKQITRPGREDQRCLAIGQRGSRDQGIHLIDRMAWSVEPALLSPASAAITRAAGAPWPPNSQQAILREGQ